MDLPTYTNIWRIEKRLYKLYDLKLPMPLPIVWIGVFAGVLVPWSLLLLLVGLPFEAPWHVVYLVPPGVVTWLSTRPVIESKRLTELLQSQLRYMGEPRTWCRMAPDAEPAEIAFTARVWRAAPKPAGERAKAKAKAPRRARHAATVRRAQRATVKARQVRPAVAAAAAAAATAPVTESAAPPPSRTRLGWGSREAEAAAQPRAASRGTGEPARARGTGEQTRARDAGEPTRARGAGEQVRATSRGAAEARGRGESRGPGVRGTAGARREGVAPALSSSAAPPMPETGKPVSPETGTPLTFREAGKLVISPALDPGGPPRDTTAPGRGVPVGSGVPAGESPPELPEPPGTVADADTAARTDPGNQDAGRAGSGEPVVSGGVEGEEGALASGAAAPEGAEAAASPAGPIGVEALRRLRRLAASAGVDDLDSGGEEDARESHRRGQPPRPVTRLPKVPDARRPQPADLGPGHEESAPEPATFPLRVPAAGRPGDDQERHEETAREEQAPQPPSRAPRALRPVPHPTPQHNPEAPQPSQSTHGTQEPPRSTPHDRQPAQAAPGAQAAEHVTRDPGHAGQEAAGHVTRDPGHGGREVAGHVTRDLVHGGREVTPDSGHGGREVVEHVVSEAVEGVPAAREVAQRVTGDPGREVPWAREPVQGVPGARVGQDATVQGREAGQQDGREGADVVVPRVSIRAVPAGGGAVQAGPAAVAGGGAVQGAGPSAGEREPVREAPPRPRRVESVVGRDPSGGWRRLAQVVIGSGGSRTDGSEIDEARTRAPFEGGRRVVVLGCTGGAGQSTTALMLGHTFAQYREDRVLAVDANVGASTLTGRIPVDSPETLSSLLGGLDRVGGSYLAMRTYTSRTASGLEVIAGDTDAGAEQRMSDRTLFSDQRLGQAMDVLDRHYKLVVLDPAAALAARVLPYADQLVLVVPASEDGPDAVAMTYDWLDGHGCAHLRRRAIMVVNGVSRRSMNDVEQAEAVARGRCRAIVRVPWEDDLAPGSPEVVEPVRLRAASRRAYLALAGVVVAGFVTPQTRKNEEEVAQ
ncbi:hypothetical protein Misp01_25490 [Microtetraspora sp. NBRC 13810]|uniref:TcpE family conjugal transfer membrane protein n=1 Tax=Microtetraspora sp. NBRC 13810 TaxID=3030990 RepID=UPI0024A5D4A1|nr:TcpE family conjugal transfer membrane protein [Microtetraspora sp. NBRC 13810]GLW07419.1 hypothetical protein Misp01_25490 [Microtetraspora sp. NBRC 13810]